MKRKNNFNDIFRSIGSVSVSVIKKKHTHALVRVVYVIVFLLKLANFTTRNPVSLEVKHQEVFSLLNFY